MTPGALDLAVPAALAVLSAALVLALVRVLLGPTASDRVIALDLASFVAIGMILAHAVHTGEPSYLDVATAVALITFLATVGFARHIERRALEHGPAAPTAPTAPEETARHA